ncbi:hypothetical protein SSTU70S_01119 [Stutzerimonas stutzeri]
MDALKEVNRVMFSLTLPQGFFDGPADLGAPAHVHRNTVRNAPESEKVQAYIRDSVKVLRAVTDMGTDVTNAIFWFKNEPLSTFGYKTAEEVVSEGKTEQLIAFLQSWEAGGRAGRKTQYLFAGDDSSSEVGHFGETPPLPSWVKVMAIFEIVGGRRLKSKLMLWLTVPAWLMGGGKRLRRRHALVH